MSLDSVDFDFEKKNNYEWKAVGLLDSFSSLSHIWVQSRGSFHFEDDPFFSPSFGLQGSLGHIRELF